MNLMQSLTWFYHFFHLFPSQYMLQFSHEIDVAIVVQKMEVKKSTHIFETHSLILTTSLQTNTSHVFDIMVIFRKPNDHSGEYSILKLLDKFISNVLKWF